MKIACEYFCKISVEDWV